jgi:hypothetical protein
MRRPRAAAALRLLLLVSSGTQAVHRGSRAAERSLAKGANARQRLSPNARATLP